MPGPKYFPWLPWGKLSHCLAKYKVHTRKLCIEKARSKTDRMCYVKDEIGNYICPNLVPAIEAITAEGIKALIVERMEDPKYEAPDCIIGFDEFFRAGECYGPGRNHNGGNSGMGR